MQEDQALRAGNDASPGARIFPGVFLTSMAVLMLEISLTRIFSYTIWYHFTYVTISLAMLGFGASGVILASSTKLAAMKEKLYLYSSLTAALSVPLMLIVISKVPFHPFELFQDPIQLFYLLIYYIAVTSPFFCGGLTISSVFRSRPTHANKIYFWDLLGAGAGCLAIVAGIYLLGVPAVAALSASLFLLAAALFLAPVNRVKRNFILAAALVWAIACPHVEKVLEFKPSKEKWISLANPEKIDFSKWSPIFRVDAYEVDSFVYLDKDGGLYGVRNKYLPPDIQFMQIAHDGDGLALMIRSDRDLSGYNIFQHSLLRLPYLLEEKPKVLIIGAGGGVEVGTAVQNDAQSVLAVELDPITVDLVRNRYADFVGHLYERPQVKVIADEGRSFLKRSAEKFDVIQMTGVDTMAALTSGAYVLAENYLYTSDAYGDFLDHLTPDGVLGIAIFDFHHTIWFPRHVVRQVAISLAALEAKGIENPQNNIAVISSLKSGLPYISIMTRKRPYTLSEVAKLENFAEEHSFDIWHLPGQRYQNPVSQLLTLNYEGRKEYFKNNPLRVSATTDDSPFFFHFYKWTHLFKYRFNDPGHPATGQLILLLILGFSLFFSVALIVFPLYKFQKAGLGTRRKWNYVAYFAALGLGFIFIEISFIQRFILFLGYPTYSLTVILFSLLTFSGVGSYLSGRLPLSPKRIILYAFIALSIVGLGYIGLLPKVFHLFLQSTKQVRILVSLLLLFPLGLLLGMFFPSGIRIISQDDSRFVPWAWGINGCASVIGTVLSIIIAISYGFSIVTFLALLIYLFGVGALLLGRKENPELLAIHDRAPEHVEVAQ